MGLRRSAVETATPEMAVKAKMLGKCWEKPLVIRTWEKPRKTHISNDESWQAKSRLCFGPAGGSLARSCAG